MRQLISADFLYFVIAENFGMHCDQRFGQFDHRLLARLGNGAFSGMINVAILLETRGIETENLQVKLYGRLLIYPIWCAQPYKQ